MKTFIRRSGALILAVTLQIFFFSCDRLPSDEAAKGVIRFCLKCPDFTKSPSSLPDSSRYILTVKSSTGSVIYEGLYGDAPSSMSVAGGNYAVSVRSSIFNPPSFDTPVYGDDQVVQVPSGGNVEVHLECALVNCGVRLLIDHSFLSVSGALVLKSHDGSIMYGYSERRTAYFNPGEVSLALSSQGADNTMLTRSLEAREILRLKVSAASSGGYSSGITVSTDTSAVWIDDSYVIGGTPLYDVPSARGMTGAEGVWVYGYIVGCASPFLGTGSETNLAISSRTTATDKDECLSVELTKGDLRDALNLVSHPSYIGRKVFLKGNITTYYSMPGVKKISEWSLDSPPQGIF